MFGIGDEVRTKVTGEKGFIVDKIKNANYNIYLVEGEKIVREWYQEGLLKSETIPKIKPISKFEVGDEVRIKTTGETGAIINKIEHDNRNDYLVRVKDQDFWYLENILELATVSKTETTTNYDIKSDQNKPRLSLVPIQPIWTAIARVREYGVSKYGDNESWKKVELKRYHDALLRHTAAITMDLNSIDEESGLPHRWHIACNLAFIEALMEER